MVVLLLTQVSSSNGVPLSSLSPLPSSNPPLPFKPYPRFLSNNPKRPPNLTIARADSRPNDPTTPSPPLEDNETVFVGEERVPLEGVIRFDKPDLTSQLSKWGRVAVLAGGDVLALLLFSAVGRFSHGFPVLDVETLRTADPFIAGWFLGAYFLGGYGEDGRGMNGFSKALIASSKSWGVGIPLGLVIRAVTSGRIPSTNFVLVTMGSTAVVLIGWRALLFAIFSSDKSQKNDVYRRGSPFELFELLTSLVRRW